MPTERKKVIRLMSKAVPTAWRGGNDLIQIMSEIENVMAAASMEANAIKPK
jgi:hypothetical protein